jgi:hypothetical protein
MRTKGRAVAWALGATLSMAIVTAVHAQSTSSSGGLLSSLTSYLSGSSSSTTGTTGVTSSLLSQQQSVIASNIQQNASQCATGTQPGTVGYAIQQAQNVHLQLASVRPNTDSLFSISNNCFTGLSQLFDLSPTIPSLSSILGAAAAAVLAYAKQQVCQAVGQVTQQVTTPLNQAIMSVNGTVGASAINGMIGQQMSTVDPNLGSAWNGNATTSGSYTVNANSFGINQSSFSSGSTNIGSLVTGGTGSTSGTTTTVPVITTTTTTVTTPQQSPSTVSRLLNLIK